MSVPVIDLFAGPGGLGEGFFREQKAVFEIAVSIEKDDMAHETLRLRSAHRHLSRERVAQPATWELWDSIVETTPWNVLFHTLRDCGDPAIRSACFAADREALHMELGPANRKRASLEIRDRLKRWTRNSSLPSNAVLIGGPPCQAYSVVGRSRNRGKQDYLPEADHRHFLYKEYLHVIAEFMPAVFVMENVKGILTSKVNGRHIFQTIMDDLQRPGGAKSSKAGDYVLLALPSSDALQLEQPAPEDFVVCAENFGIPQARHRVIIVGVRRDVFEAVEGVQTLKTSPPPTVNDVIGDLPPLRPAVSYRGGGCNWTGALDDAMLDAALRQLRRSGDDSLAGVANRMEQVRSLVRAMRRDPGAGAERLRRSGSSASRHPRALADWFRDRPSDLLTNHESRAHMPSDLVRYLFVSAFGEELGRSPKLADFPRCLLPAHRNVNAAAIDESIFKDRFRVQVGSKHSMTVTSHIAKDGHAFIHPKARQCRSLTVREAARLQTFPDSYVFLGSRTSQYTQVGNAVPPFLAYQIAGVVADILVRARLA